MNPRIWKLISLTAVIVSLASCGRKPPNFPAADVFSYPQVQFKIQMAGKDVPNANVELRAKDGKSPQIVSHYDGDADCYKFFTIEGQEKIGGVPEGEYTVAIKPGKMTKVQIPAKYASPQSSGLIVKVEKTSTALPPIELTQ